MPTTTTTRSVDGVTILDVIGQDVRREEGAALRDLVDELVAKGHRKILLNLGAVTYIDSSGLGNLVSGCIRVRMYDGELKLLNPTDKVHKVLQITKLSSVFDIIMNDEAAAIKSFGQSATAAG
jgi:anti-sigma B factor antagonist